MTDFATEIMEEMKDEVFLCDEEKKLLGDVASEEHEEWCNRSRSESYIIREHWAWDAFFQVLSHELRADCIDPHPFALDFYSKQKWLVRLVYNPKSRRFLLVAGNECRENPLYRNVITETCDTDNCSIEWIDK